jgi:hypothetical protein
MNVRAPLAALILGMLACAGDVPAAQPWAAGAQARCQEGACGRDASSPSLSDGICFSLSIEGWPEYVLCWPGSVASWSVSKLARNVLTSFQDAPQPGTAGCWGPSQRWLCVRISSHALTLTVTLSTDRPPDGRATRCLILAAARPGQPTSGAASLHF